MANIAYSVLKIYFKVCAMNLPAREMEHLAT